LTLAILAWFYVPHDGKAVYFSHKNNNSRLSDVPMTCCFCFYGVLKD